MSGARHWLKRLVDSSRLVRRAVLALFLVAGQLAGSAQAADTAVRAEALRALDQAMIVYAGAGRAEQKKAPLHRQLQVEAALADQSSAVPLACVARTCCIHPDLIPTPAPFWRPATRAPPFHAGLPPPPRAPPFLI